MALLPAVVVPESRSGIEPDIRRVAICVPRQRDSAHGAATGNRTPIPRVALSSSPIELPPQTITHTRTGAIWPGASSRSRTGIEGTEALRPTFGRYSHGRFGETRTRISRVQTGDSPFELRTQLHRAHQFRRVDSNHHLIGSKPRILSIGTLRTESDGFHMAEVPPSEPGFARTM